ncbi:MAG: glycosyltransferase family 4 protein [Ruthenibacterium sp.]
MVYCFFSAQYLPVQGGVERYTESLAHLLHTKGHAVLIVTSERLDLPAHETDAQGVEIIRLPAWNILQGRLPLAKPDIMRRLRATLATRHIDRIVVQTRLYPLCLAGMRFACEHKIPFLTIEHGSAYVGAANSAVRLAEKIYENQLMKRAKKCCSHFYAVSDASAKWLAHFGVQSRGVLYNSVDAAAIASVLQEKNSDVRTELSLPACAPIVIFAGRLVHEKGILQLRDAVCQIHAQTGLHLLIAGDGPLYQTLAQNPKDCVHLLGSVPRKKVLALLAQSTMFCLPSDAEGFPTSVLEAIVCGCFVITAPYGGAKEIITGKEYGCVMPGNTKADIASALCAALADAAYCKQAVLHAKKRFEEAFTWEKTCQKLEAAFFDIQGENNETAGNYSGI